MRGNSRVRQKRRETSQEKMKLPHTRDPEFAKPTGQDKKKKQGKDKNRKRRGERRLEKKEEAG